VPTVSPDAAEKNVQAPVKDTASEKKIVPVNTVVAEKKTTPVKKTAPVKRTAANKKKTTPVKKVDAVVQTADKANKNQTKQPEQKKSVVTVQPAETAQSSVTVEPEKNIQPTETAKISEPEKTPAVEPKPEIKKEDPVITVGTPSIYSPEMKKVFTENDFTVSSPQITFSWSEVPDTTWYLFTLYQGSDLTKKIAMYKVTETTFSLKEDKLSTLENGVYTWTVTAISDKKGKRYFGSPVEAQFSLSISDVDTVTLDTSQLIDAR
jgi:hypothetical protein